MAFAIVSDPVLDVTWWVTVSSAVLSYLIVVFVIGYRGYFEMINRRRKRVEEKWEDILYTAVGLDNDSFADLTLLDLLPISRQNRQALIASGEPIAPGQYLSESELPHFLFTWNYIEESVKGDAAHRLAVLAGMFDLKNRSRKMLHHSLLKNKLLAINTLGNLKAKETYEEVAQFAWHTDPVVSVWAFRAMFRIRPYETRNVYLRLIAEREDWSPAHVAKILGESGPELISGHLVSVVEDAYRRQLDERQLARLVSYMTFAHERDYAEFVDRILAESDQMEVLIAAMRLLRSSASLPRVRKLLKSDQWPLRMYAAITLGRFGEREDARRLINTMGDLEWWVRYHSAKALVAMPMIRDDRLKQLSQRLSDDFQRDILGRVLAEEEFQCQSPTSSGLSS